MSLGYNSLFATQLRKAMNPKNGERVTNTQLAEAINMTPQMVSNYVTGKNHPGLDVVVKIAEYLDVSLDYLLKGISSENQDWHQVSGLSEEAISTLRYLGAREDFDHPQALAELDQILTSPGVVEYLHNAGEARAKIEATLAAWGEDEYEQDIDVPAFLYWQLLETHRRFTKQRLEAAGVNVAALQAGKLGQPQPEDA